jgi:O-Antigen ligase
VQVARYLPAAVIVPLFVAIAYANGGYGLSSRTLLAVGLWGSIMIGVGFGLIPREAIGGRAVIVGGLLAGFAAWTFASTFWTANAENAFNEFNRVSLYLAVLVLAVAAALRGYSDRTVDGLCVGIVATIGISLSSRLFPDLFSTRQLEVLLPSAATRLSFPVGYWNGLGILASLAFPLCFRTALVARRAWIRALGVGVTPLLSAVIYLTSSRGAVATALVATAVFLLATDRRWTALGVVLATGVGSTLAVAALVERRTLVNGPFHTGVAESQGRVALVLIVAACVLTAALLVAGETLLRGRFRAPRPAAWALAGVVVAAAAIAIAFAHPIARFEEFKQPPVAGRLGPANFANAHLLSGNGSGRWQFWGAALDEFRSAPLQGRGAGSYESWWAQHASFTYFLRNAHSLYLEVLGELGLVGFALIVGAFGAGIAIAVQHLRTRRGDDRVTLAAVTAVFAAFLAGAAIDWIWQLTVVGIVGLVALGLIVGRATAEDRPTPELGAPRSWIALGAIVLVATWALICAQAIPWLAAAKVSDSQADVRRGDTRAALQDALDAKSLQPWAASPYTQLALIAEQRGDLAAAQRWIAAAARRASTDWRIWFIAARIEREAGRDEAAARSYATARSLNPRSPLFNERARG